MAFKISNYNKKLFGELETITKLNYSIQDETRTVLKQKTTKKKQTETKKKLHSKWNEKI